jgi:predicted hydrocarbon binding protein
MGPDMGAILRRSGVESAMHGSILYLLTKFISSRVGEGGLQKILATARRQDVAYVPTMMYPDGDAVAIVTAAAQLTGQPAGALLDAFGEYIVPSLLTLYEALVDPSWKTLDLLENTESTIHRVVRMKSPGAEPPRLKCRRESRDEVVIVYESERRMCDVAVGIIRGVADHYGEQVEIHQRRCMQRSDDHCEIVVRQLPGSAGG